ncbi:hypothetical protein ABBQ38_003262 [Trebouxia sp. C0009 RCD-2024]
MSVLSDASWFEVPSHCHISTAMTTHNGSLMLANITKSSRVQVASSKPEIHLNWQLGLQHPFVVSVCNTFWHAAVEPVSRASSTKCSKVSPMKYYTKSSPVFVDMHKYCVAYSRDVTHIAKEYMCSNQIRPTAQRLLKTLQLQTFYAEASSRYG